MAGINLKVQIEMNGQFIQAGHITGSSFRDAAFSYDESYITSSAARAISLSLPLSKKDFDTVVIDLKLRLKSSGEEIETSVEL